MRRTARDTELARLRARTDLEDRLRRSLDTAGSEHDALAMVEDALAERHGRSMRILVPDPAALRLGPARVPGPDATLIEASSCMAFRRAATVVTPSNTRFDACGHLRDIPDGASGVCVPVVAAGSLVGVIQWTGAEHAPLDAAEVGAVESLAHLLACHVLVIRARSIDTPRIDPLTGLLNPHSIDRAIMRLVTELVPFSLAVCTLDGFDGYNETHGHEAGDQALRLFARSLTATVRPDDIVGRSDLDRFTVVFPATSALDAAHALERVRETLVLSLSQDDLPNFTASFGVADSNQGDSIEAIVETAEVAVALARDAGSNRVVVAGEETGAGPDLDT
jgi:diguanylate cyclase (GGDEF)-like protein